MVQMCHIKSKILNTSDLIMTKQCIQNGLSTLNVLRIIGTALKNQTEMQCGSQPISIAKVCRQIISNGPLR